MQTQYHKAIKYYFGKCLKFISWMVFTARFNETSCTISTELQTAGFPHRFEHKHSTQQVQNDKPKLNWELKDCFVN